MIDCVDKFGDWASEIRQVQIIIPKIAEKTGDILKSNVRHRCDLKQIKSIGVLKHLAKRHVGPGLLSVREATLPESRASAITIDMSPKDGKMIENIMIFIPEPLEPSYKLRYLTCLACQKSFDVLDPDNVEKRIGLFRRLRIDRIL